MKKILHILIFILIIFLLLSNSYDIIESIKFSFSICINNLFPSLIPFMLLSNILINYNFIDELSSTLEYVMIKVFKVNKNCAFAFIMSILSGTPSNSKYLKDLYDNNLIEISDINKCLIFCHFTNPIFILGTIGNTFLNSKSLGLIILISHYTSSIILALFNKDKSQYTYNHIINKKKRKNFISILKQSINSTFETLLLILGIITTCIIITCIINNIIAINDNYKFIYGFIEITQGLKYLSISNLSIEIKAILSSSIISFGGICIHMQVFSILDNKKVRYLPYLIARISHALISSIITFILITLFD